MYITDSIQPLCRQYAFLSVIRLQNDEKYSELDDEAFDEEDENWEYEDEEFIESDDGDGDFDSTGRALDENPYGGPDE